MDDTPRPAEPPFVPYADRSEWVSLADLFRALAEAIPARDDEIKSPGQLALEKDLGARWEVRDEFSAAATEGAIDVRAIDSDDQSCFIPRVLWWWYRDFELISQTGYPRVVSSMGRVYDYLDVRRAEALRVWPFLRLGPGLPATPQSGGKGEADAPDDSVIREWLVCQYQKKKSPLKGNDRSLLQECRETFIGLTERQYVIIFRSLDQKYRHARGRHKSSKSSKSSA